MSFLLTNRQVGDSRDQVGWWVRIVRFFTAIQRSQWIVYFLILGLLAAIPQSNASSSLDFSSYPWLYLRQSQPLEPAEQVVEIILVGDIMMGRQVAQTRDAFSGVSKWLSQADLAVGNLESTLAGMPSPEQTPTINQANAPIILAAPPSAANHLNSAGFDVLGMANNHALDLGSSALFDTFQLLHDRQLVVTGLKPPGSDAQPVILTVDGLRVAFLAFTMIKPPKFNLWQDNDWLPAVYQSEEAVSCVKSARSQADIVIVLMHWGEEYIPTPTPIQKQIAEELTAAGADLVAGSHPHVIQPTWVVPRDRGQPRDRFVAFSLGNFIFDQPFIEARQGLALRAFFDQDGLRAVQGLPVRSGERPALAPIAEARGWLWRSKPNPQPVKYTCNDLDCQAVLVSNLTPAGPFSSGEIDLTGDGIPEQVFKRGQQALIYEGNRLAWQSPSEWRVLDLALGDPNDDGRGELLISLRKRDANGIERSHPFIFGYRLGSYRLLWGGSAVSSPIGEVELADVSGDGAQELVELEERGQPGQHSLSIWRWHGWGFSLIWRSQPDWYQNLSIIDPAASRAPEILLERGWAPP